MNDLRTVHYRVLSRRSGVVTFSRTKSRRKRRVKSCSKDRLVKAVRRYEKSGYRVIPNPSGWTLIVKEWPND